MDVNLVALVAGSSVQSVVLENTFKTNGQEVKRFPNVATAARDPDVDVILVEDILVHEDLPKTDAVLIGIDPRPYKISNYDAVLYYPVRWEQFVGILDASTPKIFDPNVRKQIEELLGKEAFRSNLNELVSEIDGAIADFDGKTLDEQISIVHKISGVSAMLGVRELHHELLAMEVKGKAGDASGFHMGWQNFIKNWPAKRDEIKTFIAT